MTRVLPALLFVSSLCIQQAQADMHFQVVFGRSGTVSLSGTESNEWVLATTDTDESTKYTNTSGPLGVNGALAPFGQVEISFEGFGIFGPPVEVSTLGGSVFTREPHSIDSGTWAFGMAVLDWQGLLATSTVESYFQMRLAGSSAVVQDTSLAAKAVAEGRWPSIDAYIEFHPSNAGYAAWSNPDPIQPSDYIGFTIPECSSAALMLIGLTTTLLRRSRVC